MFIVTYATITSKEWFLIDANGMLWTIVQKKCTLVNVIARCPVTRVPIVTFAVITAASINTGCCTMTSIWWWDSSIDEFIRLSLGFSIVTQYFTFVYLFADNIITSPTDPTFTIPSSDVV